MGFWGEDISLKAMIRIVIKIHELSVTDMQNYYDNLLSVITNDVHRCRHSKEFIDHQLQQVLPAGSINTN